MIKENLFYRTKNGSIVQTIKTGQTLRAKTERGQTYNISIYSGKCLYKSVSEIGLDIVELLPKKEYPEYYL